MEPRTPHVDDVVQFLCARHQQFDCHRWCFVVSLSLSKEGSAVAPFLQRGQSERAFLMVTAPRLGAFLELPKFRACYKNTFSVVPFKT